MHKSPPRLLLLVVLAVITCGCTAIDEILATPEVKSEAPPVPTASVPSLVWLREGGVAGFHDTLSMQQPTEVYYAAWDGTPRQGVLTREEASAYASFVAQYASFEYVHEDNADGPDRVRITVRLEAQGGQQATQAEKAAVATWAGTVYARLRQQEDLSAAMAALARQHLAGRLDVDAAQIEFVSAESVVWPDACLGIDDPDLACAEAETPGYRVVLRHGTETYTYHTDNANTVRPVGTAPSPTPGVTDMPPPETAPAPSTTITVAAEDTLYAFAEREVRNIPGNDPVIKGQVLDAQDQPVARTAAVGYTVDGVYVQGEGVRNPAPTNPDGWYEIYVKPGQKIRLVRVVIDGKDQPLAGASTEWEAESRRWWYVDVRPLKTPPTLTPSPTAEPTATQSATATASTAHPSVEPPQPSATPSVIAQGAALTFDVREVRSIPGTDPVVKGQVFDAEGQPIARRAAVGFTVDGVYVQGEGVRNPAPTNPDGWYEIYVKPGQKIRLIKVFIDGKEQAVASPSTEWTAESRRWWYVDVRLQPSA